MNDTRVWTIRVWIRMFCPSEYGTDSRKPTLMKLFFSRSFHRNCLMVGFCVHSSCSKCSSLPLSASYHPSCSWNSDYCLLRWMCTARWAALAAWVWGWSYPEGVNSRRVQYLRLGGQVLFPLCEEYHPAVRSRSKLRVGGWALGLALLGWEHAREGLDFGSQEHIRSPVQRFLRSPGECARARYGCD